MPWAEVGHRAVRPQCICILFLIGIQITTCGIVFYTSVLGSRQGRHNPQCTDRRSEAEVTGARR